MSCQCKKMGSNCFLTLRMQYQFAFIGSSCRTVTTVTDSVGGLRYEAWHGQSVSIQLKTIDHKVEVKNGEFIFFTSDSCPLFDCVVVHSADLAAGLDSV